VVPHIFVPLWWSCWPSGPSFWPFGPSFWLSRPFSFAFGLFLFILPFETTQGGILYEGGILWLRGDILYIFGALLVGALPQVACFAFYIFFLLCDGSPGHGQPGNCLPGLRDGQPLPTIAMGRCCRGVPNPGPRLARGGVVRRPPTDGQRSARRT